MADVAAPDGSGNDAADTGWVTPDPSTGTRPETSVAVLPSILETDEAIADVSTSIDDSVVSVAAPDGSGSDAADTGCVAWKNAPLTGTAVALSWLSVSGSVEVTS